MKVGIIGLPGIGKTTLFNALTHGKAPVAEFGRRTEANIGAIAVPDHRFDHLVQYYNPKKITPASIELVDGAAPIGVDSRRSDFGSDFFTGIRTMDALIHVVRAFESPLLPTPDGGLDPLRDARKVYDELVLADLQLIENRLERIERSFRGKKIVPGSPQTMERDLVLRIQAHLEADKPLKEMDLSASESKLVKSFDFLTLKPMIVIANLAEEHADELDLLSGLRTYCSDEGFELTELVASVEMEIAQLPHEEQKEYLAAMGIAEPARDRIVQCAYRALGYISFFTVGEDEVRAWTINEGTRAVDAAGKIHSDLARGFIRAEVSTFDDFVSAGSRQAAKEAGLVRLENRDYIVRDGDLMEIRFKV